MANVVPVEAATPSRVALIPCILDDDSDQLEMMSAVIASMGYKPIATADPLKALELVRQGRCRLVLADIRLPGMDGYKFLDEALQLDPGVNVILTTGDYSLESAIDAIRRGAYDFLPKPVDRVRLKRTLDETALLYDQRRRVRELEEQLLRDLEFHGIVGKSPAMLEVFDLARKVAKHYTNILLVGATGTGKELVARAIHQLSPVGQQRLAICNCSAMVDTLLESQLFGHVRGSFTGATDTRPGLFEYANGGTVFLDEVAEMSLPMQAKLLRVIQNREIQRVGSPEVRQINVRLIAATNRDLRAEVLAGHFREEIQHGLWKKHFRADAAGANSFAEARVAGQCARIGECHFQCLHNSGGRFHRSGGLAGTTAAPGDQFAGRQRLETAVARRGAQGAHPARAGDVPGKPAEGSAIPGDRAHQPVPLPETRRRGHQKRKIRRRRSLR